MIKKETLEKVHAWREDRNRSIAGWSTTETKSAAVQLLDEIDIMRGDLESGFMKGAYARLKELQDKEWLLAQKTATIAVTLKKTQAIIFKQCGLCLYGHPFQEGNPGFHWVRDGSENGDAVLPCGLSDETRKAMIALSDDAEEILKVHDAKVEEKERLRWADAFARLVTFFSPGHSIIQGLNQAACDLRVGPLPKDGLTATKTEAGS